MVVLFTCAGQRVDIIRACRAAGAIALGADADPLAPALYHADRQAIVPRIADPGYVPALVELVREHDVRLVVPLNDLDHPVLARRRDELAPAFVLLVWSMDIMRGIVLAGGLGTRLLPMTKVTNKHLLPVFTIGR